MEKKSLLNKLLILFILFFLEVNDVIASEKKIKVFYSGFSLSNTYESNKSYAKFTIDLIKEINSDTGMDIISNKLLNTIKKAKFDNIDLDTNNLLDFDKYPDEAIVMSLALQHEEFTEEFNFATKKYSGFYDAYFQILFYDFSDQSLIASIPFDFEIQMISENNFSKEKIFNRIKEFYLNDGLFADLEIIINQFNIKRKYNTRIGVSKVKIQDKAFEEMPVDSKKYKLSYKNLIAQTFSKRLSKHHNVAIVPFMEGQSINKTMKLRFVQSDIFYSIKLPNPDYHIHITLRGFKKVLAKASATEELYFYGSFVDLKIFQPDINKIYFDESLRGVTKIKIPKDQYNVNDWRKYYYNMEVLFDKFSKNIIKPNNKWLKETSKKNIKKDLKKLDSLLENVK